MPERPQQASSRADRILDAAATLLLRMGYRKVTIEDIAKQAGIGKGTVYLHWRSKEQLFEALLRRDSILILEELLARLRKDPAEIRPHRFVRASFLATHHSQILIALIKGDIELLGKLRASPVARQDLLANDRFFDLMTRHGLLRVDVPNIAHALQAASVGFYLIDTVGAASVGFDLEARADALAHIIRHAFEPAGEPRKEAIAAVAAELCTVFDELIACYRKWIYSDEPG